MNRKKQRTGPQICACSLHSRGNWKWRVSFCVILQILRFSPFSSIFEDYSFLEPASYQLKILFNNKTKRFIRQIWKLIGSLLAVKHPFCGVLLSLSAETVALFFLVGLDPLLCLQVQVEFLLLETSFMASSAMLMTPCISNLVSTLIVGFWVNI